MMNYFFVIDEYLRDIILYDQVLWSYKLIFFVSLNNERITFNEVIIGIIHTYFCSNE